MPATLKVVTPVNGKYESKRPPVAERLFTSEAVEKKIKEVQKLLKRRIRNSPGCSPTVIRTYAGKYGALSPVG